MQDLKELDVLWATTVYNIEIDYLLNRIHFYVRSLEGGITQFYELSFERVLSFHIKNEKAHLRTLIDLEEVYYESKKNYEFSLVIGHNDTIDIECESWKLTLLEEFNEND